MQAMSIFALRGRMACNEITAARHRKAARKRISSGYGAGLFIAGERECDQANSYRVARYARSDASLFYRHNG